MKYTINFGVIIGSMLLLTACGEKSAGNTTGTTTAAAANTAERANDMAAMGMSGTEAKMVSGAGTVTAVDAAKGKVTLNHGPIPAAGWPAMTMTFDAKPAALQGVTVGEKVTFDVTLKGGAGEVTAIRKQ